MFPGHDFELPDMVDGRTGAISCTEIFLQLGAVIPQLVFANTQIFPTTPL